MTLISLREQAMRQVKARPILFSGPMVRAMLDDRKTKTRRTVKGAWLDWANSAVPPRGACVEIDGPYGNAGDLLIVRETTQFPGEFDHLKPIAIPERGRGLVQYVADGLQPGYGKQRPAIHMPRWASRLTLEITDVRVERLNDISEADARAEGLGGVETDGMDPRGWYADLWDSINGPGAWAANPWVWCVGFRVHCQNVDALLAERVAA